MTVGKQILLTDRHTDITRQFYYISTVSHIQNIYKKSLSTFLKNKKNFSIT